MPGILEGKKILVTGVLTPASIAFAIADTAQNEGADIVLTSFGRVMSLTEKSARRMKPTPDILEMDVNNQEHLDTLAKTQRTAGAAWTDSSTRSRSRPATRSAATS